MCVCMGLVRFPDVGLCVGYKSIYTIYCNILSTLDILGTNMEVTWEFMKDFSQNLYTLWVIWKCGK